MGFIIELTDTKGEIKMENHETILKMIEEIDPNDTAKLDEFDARVEALEDLMDKYSITFFAFKQTLAEK